MWCVVVCVVVCIVVCVASMAVICGVLCMVYDTLCGVCVLKTACMGSLYHCIVACAHVRNGPVITLQ